MWDSDFNLQLGAKKLLKKAPPVGVTSKKLVYRVFHLSNRHLVKSKTRRYAPSVRFSAGGAIRRGVAFAVATLRVFLLFPS